MYVLCNIQCSLYEAMVCTTLSAEERWAEGSKSVDYTTDHLRSLGLKTFPHLVWLGVCGEMEICRWLCQLRRTTTTYTHRFCAIGHFNEASKT